VQGPPKSFDFVKIREKSMEIWAQSVQIFANFLQIRAKMELDTEKNGAQNDMKTFFLWRSFSLYIFSGTFGEIWAKILRTPKMCSYSYTLSVT